MAEQFTSWFVSRVGCGVRALGGVVKVVVKGLYNDPPHNSGPQKHRARDQTGALTHRRILLVAILHQVADGVKFGGLSGGPQRPTHKGSEGPICSSRPGEAG